MLLPTRTLLRPPPAGGLGSAHRPRRLCQHWRSRALLSQAPPRSAPRPEGAPDYADAEARRTLEAQLERRLAHEAPAAEAQPPRFGGSADLQAIDRLGAPGRPSGEAAAATRCLQQAALEAAVAAAPAEVPHSQQHHHHHHEGPLTTLLNQALGKLGIHVSDRARGLICLNVSTRRAGRFQPSVGGEAVGARAAMRWAAPVLSSSAPGPPIIRQAVPRS